MEIFDTIVNMNNAYYVGHELCAYDSDVSSALKIDHNLYIQLLKRYNAFQHSGQYYFKTYKAAEKFINDPQLRPYIMLYKLSQ